MKQPEKLLQQQCYQLFLWKYSNTGAIWHHSPNENLSTTNRYKAIKYNEGLTNAGRQKGFPDIMVLYKGRCIFIELKSEKGRQSEEQKEIQKQIENNGFDYFLCKTLDDVDNILNNFFKLVG